MVPGCCGRAWRGRAAESLGAEIAADERQHVQPLGNDSLPSTLYLGIDGTGVPMRASELSGHVKEHLSSVAKAIYGADTAPLQKWTQDAWRNSIAAVCPIRCARSVARPTTMMKPGNAFRTSTETASGCVMIASTLKDCVPRPVSSRRAAKLPSALASSAPECTGLSAARMPLSPCDAANSAAVSTTSGNDATASGEPPEARSFTFRRAPLRTVFLLLILEERTNPFTYAFREGPLLPVFVGNICRVLPVCPEIP